MTTLIYFASGCYRKEYQDLDVDKIYLIDNCFRNKRKYNKNIFKKGKVICIGMDSLEAVRILKKKHLKIDYFVSLNEGLYEGGGNYAINSDMFLGYAMPLFKDEYIHIMNKDYYHNRFNVSMDLPFNKNEIFKNDKKYIDPMFFSNNTYGYAKVFKMQRITDVISADLNSKIKLTIKHESIWSYYNELELVILSLSYQGQGNFFKDLKNVIDINKTTYKSILELCVKNKITKIGFTPWLKGNYKEFFEVLRNYKKKFPREITLFHLNNLDYVDIKKDIYTFNNKKTLKINL